VSGDLAHVRQKEQWRCRKKDGEYGYEQTCDHIAFAESIALKRLSRPLEGGPAVP
jgi:hypothetical protein